MLNFKEWLLIDNFNTSFDNQFTLCDIPQVFPFELNQRYIEKHLIQPLQKAKLEGKVSVIDLSKGYLVAPIYVDGSIYIKTTKDGVTIGATKILSRKYCNIQVMVPEVVKKYDNKASGIALELYKVCYEDTKTPIMSGELQSEYAMNMWKKWYNNPSKYGINKIKVVNIKDCKELDNPQDVDIWGEDVIYKDIRLILIF